MSYYEKREQQKRGKVYKLLRKRESNKKESNKKESNKKRVTKKRRGMSVSTLFRASSIKMAATYSPTVTQYHRRDWA